MHDGSWGAFFPKRCRQRSCGGNRSAQTELECLRARLGEAERGLSERRLEADEVRIATTFPTQLMTESCPRVAIQGLN